MKTLLLAAALAFAPPGRLLVEAPPYGAAIVEPSGQITRLGAWYDTAWSPDGSRVAGTDGRRIAVIGAWTLRRELPSQPAWSSDGSLLAYVSDRKIRVVGADGRGDRLVGHGERVGWRPGTSELAYVDHRGVIRLRDVASRRTLWRARPGLRVRPRGLIWSPDGRRLSAISGSYVRQFGARGTPLRRIEAGRAGHFQSGVYAGNQLVLVRHDFARGTTLVTRGKQVVFSGRGSVIDVTPSPDGTRLLLGRRWADEWQLWPPAPPIRGVTKAINPEATGRWAFPATRGWR